MLQVSDSATIEAHEKRDNMDLYKILRTHIGSIMLIRHAEIERVGVLQRITFKRRAAPNESPIFYSFDSEDRRELNVKQQVEILEGDRWKVLHYGHFEGNREL